MKKIIYALLVVVLVSGLARAAQKEPESVNAGVLTYLGSTEEEFQTALDDLRKAVAPLIPLDEEFNSWEYEDRLEGFISSLVKTRRKIKFYDSLLAMQMALRARRIDEIALPECTGLYLVTNNPNYEVLFSLNMEPSTISFGFRRGDTALQKEFNSAISSMKKDGTLRRLEEKYISEYSSEPEEAKFQNFKGAKVIKVAVTGDLPPIDFIAADGKPAGYNTAILAEIGKRLKKNVQLISVDSAGRSAALASKRADVVFWYRNSGGIKTSQKLNKDIKGRNLKGAMRDGSDSVIFSMPYYEWDTDLIIGRSK